MHRVKISKEDKVACRNGLRGAGNGAIEGDEDTFELLSRRHLWPKLINVGGRGAYYRAALFTVFGNRGRAEDGVEVAESRTPTLGLAEAEFAQLVVRRLAGQEEALRACRRVLCVLAQQQGLRYCPQAPFLVAWLLDATGEGAGVDEATAFAVVECMVSARPQRLFCDRASLHAFVYALWEFSRERCKASFAALERLATMDDFLPIFAPILTKFLSPLLNSDKSVGRVLDVFVAEGPKVLLRLVLAVLKASTIALESCEDASSVTAALASCAASVDYDTLSRQAFGLRNFSRDAVNDRIRTFTKLEREAVADPEPSWYHPKLLDPPVGADGASAPRNVLSAAEVDELAPYFPAAAQLHDLRVVYSTERHGWGLVPLFRVMKERPVAPCVVAVSVLDPAKEGAELRFGAVCTDPLIPKKKGWVGDSGCCVFCMDPLRVYTYRGETLSARVSMDAAAAGVAGGAGGAEEPPVHASSAVPVAATADVSPTPADRMFQMATSEFLAFGGNSADTHVALRLSEDLRTATTSPCTMYGSPHLAGPHDSTSSDVERELEVMCVEVLGFVDNLDRLVVAASRA